MEKGLNLELILVGVTFLAGLIILVHYLMRRGKPKQSREENPLLVDYAKSFFPILLIVIVIRSFVAEPFRIPSGSMIPTLEIGDFILVKKYSYGIRLPIIQTKIMDIGEPKRGDVIVFRYPPQPQTYFIKRLVGLPGDHIEWTKNKELTINGKLVKSQMLGDYQTKDDTTGRQVTANKLKETFENGVSHNLLHHSGFSSAGEWDVPEGHYFMMGDNRDKSSDSRYWGFVPEKNLVGKASLVWMHWNWLDGGDGFKSERIGTAVN